MDLPELLPKKYSLQVLPITLHPHICKFTTNIRHKGNLLGKFIWTFSRKSCFLRS